MKSDKLQDAIGRVDPALVERTEQKRKIGARLIKWTAPVAALLAVAIIVSVLFGQDTVLPSTQIKAKAYVLTEAEYPKMVQYSEDYYSGEYEEWYDGLQEKREYYDAGDGLEPFFSTVASTILGEKENENCIISPVNMFMALSMLAETAAGGSREEILELLGVEDMQTLREKSHGVWNANYFDEGTVKSILGNSLWLNDGISAKKDTLDILKTKHYASIYSGEMGSESYEKAFHDWLNRQTGNLLENEVAGVDMTPDSGAILASTIYYGARWNNEFSATKTEEKIFHGKNGNKKTEFMHKTGLNGYYWGEGFGAVSEGLQNSGAMWFFLPDEGVEATELLKNGTVLDFLSKGYEERLESHKYLMVNLAVPKFDVSSTVDFGDELKKMGITECFSPQKADFSSLTDTKLWIGGAQHSARVKINEEGVEAAAFTSIDLAGAGMPNGDEIDFVLDRPFIFVITGADSLPLFVGIINNA